MDYVIGLDLSLTSPGVCRIPLDWGCDFRRCNVSQSAQKGKAPRDDMERAQRLDGLCCIIEQEIALCPGRIRGVAIESLPTHGAHNLVTLGELHGVVRCMLMRRRIWTRTAPQATARKLLLGALPRKDAKEVVRQTVRSFEGCASWGGDEVDAFVAANWLLAEMGEAFVSAPKG